MLDTLIDFLQITKIGSLNSYLILTFIKSKVLKMTAKYDVLNSTVSRRMTLMIHFGEYLYRISYHHWIRIEFMIRYCILSGLEFISSTEYFKGKRHVFSLTILYY